MPDLNEQIRDELSEIVLYILIFGPNPDSTPEDDHDEGLRLKRIQIKEALAELGHDARFPEEQINAVTDPEINPVVAERFLIANADLLVVLAKTPGTLVEIGFLAFQTELAMKSHLFMSQIFEGGLSHQTCRHLADLGAEFSEYVFPGDLDSCHLLGQVVDKVRRVQIAKYFA